MKDERIEVARFGENRFTINGVAVDINICRRQKSINKVVVVAAKSVS